MDSERTIQDARSVCRDLNSIFTQDGEFPEDTLDEITRLCEIARLVADDRHCDYELYKVERYAACLLSGDTTHWGRGGIAGHACLRRLILDLLKAVDLRLETQALQLRSNICKKALARTTVRDWRQSRVGYCRYPTP